MSDAPSNTFRRPIAQPLKVLSLFAGIGGFDLGLERTGGFKTVAFCEINPFARRVLAKHWPEVPCFEDVRTLTSDALAERGITVDVICGGFPCQDISLAGRQAGLDGARSGLWSEITRLVGQLRPRLLIVENVTALLSGPSERPGAWFGRVLGDLAALGYDAEWHSLPASHVGAPHQRDRIWLVANPGGEQHQGASHALWGQTAARLLEAAAAYADRERCGEARSGSSGRGVAGRGGPIEHEWNAEPDVGRVAHGVPQRVDRLRALGNAVVPQIPELIGRAILASLSDQKQEAA